MRTVRRLYLYAVAMISLEVVLWGLVEFARSLLSDQLGGDNLQQLSEVLSLSLVGVPVFSLHWWLAQRGARQDEQERSAGLRAMFLYGMLAVTLIPVSLNALALVNRAFLQAFGLPPQLALVGGDQSWRDNLFAVAVNVSVAAYFFSVLRDDWEEGVQGEAFSHVRHLYRYFWVLYGLGMSVLGIQLICRHLLLLVAYGSIESLVEGLALSVIGLPVGGFAWWWVERWLDQPLERQSVLRYGVLFGVLMVSVAGLLVPAGVIVASALRFLLDGSLDLSPFLVEVSEPLSVAIPFGIVFVYFRGRLRDDDLPSSNRRHIQFRRLYGYVGAGFGLGAFFIGGESLTSVLRELALSDPSVLGQASQEQFATAIATLLVGIPLWVFTWRALNRAAAGADEAGNAARRSTIRKGYLYLVLFIALIGLVFTAGDLIYDLLQSFLGESTEDSSQAALEALKNLLLFGLLLGYHWMTLGVDRRRTERWLAEHHSEFPVLVLAKGVSEFTQSLVAALQQEAPSMPVAVHLVDQGAPDEVLSEAEAVILPAEVWTQPPEAIRLWLLGYAGHRVVVPLPVEGWSWAFKGK
ncbi:MAG: DUF5671 domain-containing protein, partial [Anaerolineales bacterium]